MRDPAECWLRNHAAICTDHCLQLSDAKHLPVRGSIRVTARKIVKGPFGHTDDLVSHEGRPFPGAVLRMLQAALPFHHGPAVEFGSRELREHGHEIHLPVAK